jgi:hypothetical protein
MRAEKSPFSKGKRVDFVQHLFFNSEKRWRGDFIFRAQRGGDDAVLFLYGVILQMWIFVCRVISRDPLHTIDREKHSLKG